MLAQIKIMLGLGDTPNKECENNYDSFVDDVKTSENKVGPNLDDHNMMSKVVQMLREGYDNNHDKLEEPKSEGIVEKLRRLLGKHE